MAWPLNSYAADLVARESGEAPLDPAHTVYFVATYDFPTRAAYREYATAIAIPVAKAFLHEGDVLGYSVFANRYTGGKRWQGLLVLEYKDPDAFSRRDDVLARIRTQLRNDPAYKAAESKQPPNFEREPVIADRLGAR